MTTIALLHPLVAYSLLGLFSLAIGSLLNVIIYRLPIMLETEFTTQCRLLLHRPIKSTSTINLFYPRSFCPGCKTTIPFWHNIPLLSYCLLGGRCHQCRQSISWQYPLIEIICLGLSLFAAYQFGFNIKLIAALLFIFLTLCLFVIDLKTQLLPDSLTYSLLWLGLIANTQSIFTTLPNAVLSAATAYLTLWFFIKLFYLCTKKIGMGNGDFKLFAAYGAWFGWTELPLILIISSISGAITGLIYLKTTKQNKDTPIPFGPFLCIGGGIALFYGPTIIDWYLSFYSS